MPIKKPTDLKTGAYTNARKRADKKRDEALRPQQKLPMRPPARLRDNKIASATWRKLMRLYSELDAEIVTGLDYGLVEDYCITTDEMEELRNMRTVAYQVWLELGIEHDEMKTQHMQDEAAYIAIKITDAFDAVIKLDARIDRKRDQLNKMRQLMYLTPKARTGAVPGMKEPPKPINPMDEILDEFEEKIKHDVR